jgi:hypothetical protein
MKSFSLAAWGEKQRRRRRRETSKALKQMNFFIISITGKVEAERRRLGVMWEEVANDIT